MTKKAFEKIAEGLSEVRGWDIGLTQDNRTASLGISVRRRFNRSEELFEWTSGATGAEIAAQLRNAALYLEAESDPG